MRQHKAMPKQNGVIAYVVSEGSAGAGTEVSPAPHELEAFEHVQGAASHMRLIPEACSLGDVVDGGAPGRDYYQHSPQDRRVPDPMLLFEQRG